jgi:prefoldin subunit 5
MTTEEKLDRLIERHQALTESVEMVVRSVDSLTQDVRKLVGVIESLTQVVLSHENRIGKLERSI